MRNEFKTVEEFSLAVQEMLIYDATESGLDNCSDPEFFDKGIEWFESQKDRLGMAVIGENAYGDISEGIDTIKIEERLRDVHVEVTYSGAYPALDISCDDFSVQVFYSSYPNIYKNDLKPGEGIDVRILGRVNSFMEKAFPVLRDIADHS